MAARRAPILRRLAGRLLLFALSSLVALLIAEAVVRVSLPPPQIVQIEPSPDREQRLEQERSHPMDGRAESTPLTFGLYLATPAGTRLRANTHVVIENNPTSGTTTEVRTNSLGYRNREIGPKTGTRVLFLGDSITMGEYLPEEQTFVRLVESWSKRDGEPLETINAGVAGIGLANELAILVESGLALEPDIVVVGFFLNDSSESPGVRVWQVPAALSRSYFLQHLARLWSVHFGAAANTKVPKAEIERAFKKARHVLPVGPGDPLKDRGAFYGEVLKGFVGWGHAWLEDPWLMLRPLFGELERLAIRHGFTPLVVCFPVRLQVEAEFIEDYPQRMLNEICGSLGLPVLDTLGPLREAHRQSQQPLFFDACHHTAWGNEVLARCILQFVREHLRK